MEVKRLRLGVLFSGGGRTLENLARKIAEGTLPAEVAVAISSHKEAGGIARAESMGVPCAVVDFRERKTTFSEEITAALTAARAELVCLAGFVRHYAFPAAFRGRIINIHPALLPAFGGKGFYGDRVHRAVLDSGVKFSGCTVHFASEEYDRGPIILQRIVPVHPRDTVADLAARVFAEECIAYPEAIRLHAEGRLEVRDGKVLLREAPRRTG